MLAGASRREKASNTTFNLNSKPIRREENNPKQKTWKALNWTSSIKTSSKHINSGYANNRRKKRRTKEDLVGTKHYEELGDKHLTGKMF